MDARIALILYASRQIGRAYIWGGESSEEGGDDCSGLISRCLGQGARSWPGLYDGQRRTSRGLYAYYAARGCPDIFRVEDLRPGCLVFYSAGPAVLGLRRGGPKDRIYHCAIHAATIPPLDGKLEVGPLAIEAAGGDSTTDSPRDSLVRGAGVKFGASDRHGGAAWRALDPFEVLRG